MEIVLPLEDAPDWMLGLIITEVMGEVRFTLAKHSGEHYGIARISVAKLRQMLDLLEPAQ